MYLTNRVCWDILKIFPDLTARVIQPVQFQLPPPPLARLTYDIYCIIASSQTWLLRQLSFSSQRVTGKHILQDPLVTVSGYDWGTSTLKCLLSIAKAAPPVPATRGAESTYIPDPLSHPSLLLLLHLLLPPGAQQQPAGQQEPPFSEPRTPAATKPCAASWQAPQVQVSLAARRGLKGELQGSWKGDLPSCHPVHEAIVLLFFCPALSCTHIKACTPH